MKFIYHTRLSMLYASAVRRSTRALFFFFLTEGERVCRLKMGWDIDIDNYLIILFVQILLMLIILAGIPLISLLLLCCSPVCCCMSACKTVNRNLTGIIKYLFWFLKKETIKGKTKLKISGFLAPDGYAYFLLYVAILIMIHSIAALYEGSVIIDRSVDYSNFSQVACTAKYNVSCYFIHNVLELRLVDGIEAACVTFAGSIFIFSVLTIILLKWSGGRNDCCSCKNGIILLTQAIFTCAPRLAFMFYWGYAIGKAAVDNNGLPQELLSREDGKTKIESGIVDEKSFFFIAALCDSVASGMLTPWYCFNKLEKPEEVETISFRPRPHHGQY